MNQCHKAYLWPNLTFTALALGPFHGEAQGEGLSVIRPFAAPFTWCLSRRDEL